jgi:hypothetical protein
MAAMDFSHSHLLSKIILELVAVVVPEDLVLDLTAGPLRAILE